MVEQKYIDICKRLDWEVTVYNDKTVDLEKVSPGGEFFSFNVSADSFVDDVKRYAAYFSAEEHAEMWIAAKSNNADSVPSIYEITEDAKAIDAMLKKLAEALFAEENRTSSTP